MSKDNLRDDLERLREEVNQLSDASINTREKLNVLISDLEQRLDNENDEDDSGLIENIRDYISSFETQHPRATAILNDIMVTLSNMGI